MRTIRKAGAVLLVVTIAAILTHRVTQYYVSYKDVTPGMLQDLRTNAGATGKSLMVLFGADWCSDCAELSTSLQQDAFRSYLNRNYVILRVDVGEFDRNLAVAKSLGVEVSQGIPTAVFFPSSGTSQAIRRGTAPILAYLREAARD